MIVEIWSRSSGGNQATQREELVTICKGMENDVLLGIGSVPVDILLQVRKAYRIAWPALKNNFSKCILWYYSSLVRSFLSPMCGIVKSVDGT